MADIDAHIPAPINQMSVGEGGMRSAVLSHCQNYRYALTRTWDPDLHAMVFIMLNPSTADGTKDDHTIRKCVQFAKIGGYGGIVVLNLFAYRATSPRDLRRAGWQQGPENWRYVRAALLFAKARGDLVVAAWGRHAANRQEAHELLGWCADQGLPLFAFKLSPDGTPHHPLMLPYSSKLHLIPAPPTNEGATP